MMNNYDLQAEIERLRAVVILFVEEIDDAGRIHSIFVQDAYSRNWMPGLGEAVQISNPLKKLARAALTESTNV